MRKSIFIGITIIMFFFKSNVNANYDKIFYDFKIESITGETIDFNEYKNKVILIVNTASYCGFTKQYTDLQELWDKYKSRGLIVLGVPSNSFNQEKNKNSEVKEFCKVNFDKAIFRKMSVNDILTRLKNQSLKRLEFIQKDRIPLKI